MEFSTVCEGAPLSTQALFFKRTVAMRAQIFAGREPHASRIIQNSGTDRHQNSSMGLSMAAAATAKRLGLILASKLKGNRMCVQASTLG